jgi:hypothetical protein
MILPCSSGQLGQMWSTYSSCCTHSTGPHGYALKSHIVPICDDDIHLPTILGQFQATLTTPCTYLGLPLWLDRLHREDEQALIDKVANKLPNWKGRLLNKAGRLALVNLVLSSVVTYHMTMF